jgi:hypothetical protein
MLMVALVVPWSLIKEIMEKDGAAREREEVLDGLTRYSPQSTGASERNHRRSLHGQEQRNLIWEEEEMSSGARRLGYWLVRARRRRITNARDTLQRRQHSKANLSEDFMSLFSTHPDFGNSAEEFHGDETLSTLIKLLSSLSSLIWCHISIINAYETLMKPHETGLNNLTAHRRQKFSSDEQCSCAATMISQ